jgi:RNA recognition motif-containing protein
MKIYVGNLPYEDSEEEVRRAFAEFGRVTSVILIKDSDSGRPRGFGFVEMPNAAEAQEAIRSLHGKAFKDRNLVVNQARPRNERSDRQ